MVVMLERQKEKMMGSQVVKCSFCLSTDNQWLLLLLFIPLKQDPWWVFTVPCFPPGSACFHAPPSRQVGAFIEGV